MDAPTPTTPDESGAPTPVSQPVAEQTANQPVETPWYSDQSATELLAGFESADALKARLAPSPDDPPEAWGEFYDKLGRPTTPAEYSLDLNFGEDVDPALLPTDEERAKYAEAFHAIGLSQKQVDKVIETANEIAKGNIDEIKQAQAQQAELSKEYLKEVYGDKAPVVQQQVADFVKGPLANKLPDVAQVFESQPEMLENAYVVQLLDYMNQLVNPPNIPPAVAPGRADPKPGAPVSLQDLWKTGRLPS